MLELSKGTQLADRYTLVRRLGGGGEAHMWLAKDRLTAALVALKITHGDPRSTERLRAEWQTSIRLMHAHIVRVFEFHAEADTAFYAQQYIDGTDMGALAGWSPSEVLGPVGLLADALRYTHAKGIVHRDIKASNVLLDTNGAPYLSDFGVSCATGQIGKGGSLISQSPQSLAGQPAVPSDDIFALGGLVYELVSGRSPWSSADVAADIQEKEPALLVSADGSELPAALVKLVAQMLDKSASGRPDAEAVVAGLKAAGFAPRAASVRSEARPQLSDELVETVVSVSHVARQDDRHPGVTVPDTPGVNRNVMIVSLGALLAVLIGVVVVLPNTVQEELVERPAVVQDFSPGLEANAESSVGEDRENVDAALVDPEIRRRLRLEADMPVRKLKGDDDITFNENTADFSSLDETGRARYSAELALGELLSAFEVLDGRGIQRWAPLEYRKARDLYADGDKEYLDRDFSSAEEFYLRALTVLEPTYERIEPAFQDAYAQAQVAFDEGDRLEALRLYELAVAITPSHPGAVAGYERAKNLESVLRLVDQGLEYEDDLELAAAQRSFEQAVQLDSLWEPAQNGVQRIQRIRTKMEFDLRMTEGFDSIAAGDYLGARAAFHVAQRLIPISTEPADGLLQVDQGLRIENISTLEREAQSLESDEHWDAVVKTYEEILKVDSTLSFANDGLSHAREMQALHARLDDYIAEPDRLSVPSIMQRATTLVVDITTRANIGPRLAGQRDTLSRLLKRAATPLIVPLVSDNMTDVSIYKVGRFGSFIRKEVRLRPGTYVVVGSRLGYRDVRLEFRVGPENEIEPVIVQCEEQI